MNQRGRARKRAAIARKREEAREAMFPSPLLPDRSPELEALLMPQDDDKSSDEKQTEARIRELMLIQTTRRLDEDEAKELVERVSMEVMLKATDDPRVRLEAAKLLGNTHGVIKGASKPPAYQPKVPNASRATEGAERLRANSKNDAHLEQKLDYLRGGGKEAG